MTLVSSGYSSVPLRSPGSHGKCGEEQWDHPGADPEVVMTSDPSMTTESYSTGPDHSWRQLSWRWQSQRKKLFIGSRTVDVTELVIRDLLSASPMPGAVLRM